jgi:hypothetical protein
MKKNQISQSLLSEHARLLKSNKFEYPITYFDSKVFTIPEKTQTLMSETMYSGKLPQQIIIGFVDGTASTSLAKDPFCFEDFGLDSITLKAGDQYQYRHVKMTDKQFLMAYNMLITCIDGKH